MLKDLSSNSPNDQTFLNPYDIDDFNHQNTLKLKRRKKLAKKSQIKRKRAIKFFEHWNFYCLYSRRQIEEFNEIVGRCFDLDINFRINSGLYTDDARKVVYHLGNNCQWSYNSLNPWLLRKNYSKIPLKPYPYFKPPWRNPKDYYSNGKHKQNKWKNKPWRYQKYPYINNYCFRNRREVCYCKFIGRSLVVESGNGNVWLRVFGGEKLDEGFGYDDLGDFYNIREYSVK